MARHAPITQNNKFAISLQCLAKEVSDEVDFLHAEEHEGFLQVNTMVLIGMVKYFESSQNSKFGMSLQYLKQEIRDEVDFCMQINIKVDFNTLDTKVSCKVIRLILMGMIKHSQSTQSNKFAIFLQYLRKGVRNGVLFCMQINIKVPTIWHYHF